MQEKSDKILRLYRTYRRSSITLPLLIQSTRNDLEIAEKLINQGEDYDLLREWAVQSLKAVNETVEDLSKSFDELYRIIEDSDVAKDVNVLQDHFSRVIPVEQGRNLMLASIRWNGGVKGFFEMLRSRIEPTVNAYSESASLVRPDDPSSLISAVERLRKYYEELEKLKQAYAKKLKDAMLKDKERDKKGEVYLYSNYMMVALELCEKHPQIAGDLNIDCKEVFENFGIGDAFMPCFCNWVVCLIILAILAYESC